MRHELMWKLPSNINKYKNNNLLFEGHDDTAIFEYK